MTAATTDPMESIDTMNTNWTSTFLRGAAIGAASLVVGGGLAWSVDAQTTTSSAAPTASGSPAARQAIDVRQSVYKLIGSNFRLLGDIVKGTAKYDAAEIDKRIARIAFLSDLLDGTFPQSSNIGEPETKAKPEVWTNQADFDKKLKDFQLRTAALSEINAKEQDATDAFKAGVTALGQDCKSCHDTYRAK